MRLLKDVTRTTAIWVLLGVPIASLLSAFYLLFWIILAIPRMAATAAVLGIADALWIHFAAGSRRASNTVDLFINAVFGGVLGLLGFPPVFAPTELYVERDLVIAIFIASGILAGVASGILAVTASPSITANRPIAFKLAFALLLMAVLAAVDYQRFWPETMAKLPIHTLSRGDVQSIEAGDAVGSTLTGCYSYWGNTRNNLGVSSGAFRLVQNNGTVRVTGYVGWWVIFTGAVNRNGAFRFGGESVRNSDTVRELCTGRFNGSSFQIVERDTWITKTGTFTGRLIGYGKRVPCDLSLPAIQ